MEYADVRAVEMNRRVRIRMLLGFETDSSRIMSLE